MSRDIRVIPSAALTMTTIALVAFVVQQPVAAMWAAVVALILAVAGLFTLAAEAVALRRVDDDKDRRMEDLEATIAELDQENARLHAELTDLQVGRHLRVVRDVPVADGDFPVHTTFDDDDLTVLMRATEEQ
jgi:protein involved in polysaccharide export with SLBB domain